MAGGTAFIPVASGGASAQILDVTTGNTTPGVVQLMGVTIRESAGGAARVELRAGLADTSPLGFGVNIASNGNVIQWFGPNGIRFPGGLRAVRPSGTTEIEVYVA